MTWPGMKFILVRRPSKRPAHRGRRDQGKERRARGDTTGRAGHRQRRLVDESHPRHIGRSRAIANNILDLDAGSVVLATGDSVRLEEQVQWPVIVRRPLPVVRRSGN